MSPSPDLAARERSWDPLVRLTHWGVAAAVLANGLVTEGDSPVHVWIGYAAVSLLALRLLWGLIGTEEARFSSFPPSLSAAREHVRDIVLGRVRAHRSHNPLGALMVYALWAALAVVAATGIAMAGSPLQVQEDREVSREIARYEAHGDREYEGENEHEDEDEREDEEEELLEEVHEAASTLLLVLAGLHVAGVAFESRRSGRNLARGMVTGKRHGLRER